MLTPRFLRRRWVLALIFVCSLIYFTTSIYKQSQLATVENPDPPHHPPEPFRWSPDPDSSESQANEDSPGNNKNQTVFKSCRNSVQGKILISDEKGYLCERDHLMSGGCCDTDHPETKRYVCDACKKNGCCSVYEHCVSCCLQPEKQSLLRKILGQAQDSFQPLFASVTDPFELCLAKCRTSSQSVQHENSYRDPRDKFCYGENIPDIQPVVP